MLTTVEQHDSNLFKNITFFFFMLITCKTSVGANNICRNTIISVLYQNKMGYIINFSGFWWQNLSHYLSDINKM